MVAMALGVRQRGSLHDVGCTRARQTRAPSAHNDKQELVHSTRTRIILSSWNQDRQVLFPLQGAYMA